MAAPSLEKVPAEQGLQVVMSPGVVLAVPAGQGRQVMDPRTRVEYSPGAQGVQAAELVAPTDSVLEPDGQAVQVDAPALVL